MLSRSALLLQSVVNHYERLGLKLALPKGLATTAPDAPANESTGAAPEVFRYQDFTVAQIKAAYRRKALECHPDVALDHEKAAAEAEFRRISESFALLQDAAKRKALDDDLQSRFDERITKKYGGRIVYQRRADSSKAPTPQGAQETIKKHNREAARAKYQQQRPFSAGVEGKGSSTKGYERQFIDHQGNLRSTMPVGQGAPAYDKYLRGLEIDENTPLSQMTSTWVRSTEHSSNFAGGGLGEAPSSATSSSSSSASSATRRSQRPTSSSAAMRSRRPFLRGDADKAFREAFDGKTWNEVLFQMRYESRYGGEGARAEEEKAQSTSAAESGASADSSATSSSGSKRDYKLQSPLLRNATPLSADQTAAGILNQRYSAFRQAASARFVGGPVSTPSFTSADGGSGPRRSVVSGAENLMESSAIYQKIAEFADSQFARQEHARSAESSVNDKSVAEGGSVNFPHTAPLAPEATKLGANEKPVTRQEMAKARRGIKDKKVLGVERAMRIVESRQRSRSLADLANLQTNAGKLYSYQRPY